MPYYPQQDSVTKLSKVKNSCAASAIRLPRASLTAKWEPVRRPTILTELLISTIRRFPPF